MAATSSACRRDSDPAVADRRLVDGDTRRAAQAAKYASIVIEESTGRVLFARNADKARYPASLTKIMTLYLV